MAKPISTKQNIKQSTTTLLTNTTQKSRTLSSRRTITSMVPTTGEVRVMLLLEITIRNGTIGRGGIVATTGSYLFPAAGMLGMPGGGIPPGATLPVPFTHITVRSMATMVFRPTR